MHAVLSLVLLWNCEWGLAMKLAEVSKAVVRLQLNSRLEIPFKVVLMHVYTETPAMYIMRLSPYVAKVGKSYNYMYPPHNNNSNMARQD